MPAPHPGGFLFAYAQGMTDARQLIDTLKKVQKSQGLTYADIAPRVGLSEASVKRLFSSGTFTLARLEAFCRVLDIDFFELARLARGRPEAPREMTEKQEAALAADAKLLAVFYLLLNDWTAQDIVDGYQLGTPELTRLLVRLDRLKLIDLMPNNVVRLKVPKLLRLHPGGPIHRAHGKSSTSSSPRNSIARAVISASSIASCRRPRTSSSNAGSSGCTRSSWSSPSWTARCRRSVAPRSACCSRCARGRSRSSPG